MRYLRLDENLPDPCTEPEWVLNPEDATCFDTRERAEATLVRVEDSTDMTHDDERNCWYVVRE
jgi:hypothetical protein